MRPDILTCGGQYFDLLNPHKNEYHIEDIAHALSHVCRFAGHTREFYSVAQHSVLVARHVMCCTTPADITAHGLAALLHDGAEAYIGDVASPLKQLLPDYKIIEKRVEAALFAAFGIPHPLPGIVKHFDLVLLSTEQRDLMPPHDDEWEILAGVAPTREVINPWHPEKARVEFLNTWKALAPAALR